MHHVEAMELRTGGCEVGMARSSHFKLQIDIYGIRNA